MRVLVTGATGFIGRAVVAALTAADEYEVYALVRDHRAVLPAPTLNLYADLTDLRALAYTLAPLQFDAVVHLAAMSTVRESRQDPDRYSRINVDGTARLLNIVAVSSRPAFVFASTSAVYGSHRSGLLTEDMPPDPGSPYAASKVDGERLVGFSAAAGLIGGVTLRLFNVTGGLPGIVDRAETRIVSNAVRAAAGLIPNLKINGGGSAVRDFVHVADVVDAIRFAMHHAEVGVAKTFNVGSGVGTSIAQVVEAVEVAAGRRVPVVHGPSVDEPHELVADVSRTADGIGWMPERSGIEEIVRDVWGQWDLLA